MRNSFGCSFAHIPIYSAECRLSGRLDCSGRVVDTRACDPITTVTNVRRESGVPGAPGRDERAAMLECRVDASVSRDTSNEP